MEEYNKKLFAKIPTILFYETIEDEFIEKNKCVKDNSILTNIKDSKVILILYQLYIRTNYTVECDISISKLINRCGYYNNDRTKTEFKNILNDLCKLKYINTKDNINKSKHNDLITFNTVKLIDIDKYVSLEQSELNKIISSSTSNKENINLLKVYLYLKCKSNKRKKINGGNIQKDGGKAQVAYPSYKNIAEYTYTSESHIVEYITKLKNLGMIEYKNLGKKYLENDMNKTITDCANIYIITNIVKGDFIELELKEGLKQQHNYYEGKGYIILDDNRINMKSIYGRKGFLTKKLNNKTITVKEVEELELLNTNIEEYKLKYQNKLNKKKGK